jgi:hypothetical protein
MASAMVWKVQRRNSQQRLTIAKPTAWTTAVDVPTDDSFAGDALEYTLMLNPRTARQRENQPQWAHSREALIEKLAALVVGAS